MKKKKYIIAAFAAVAALGVTSVAQSTLKGSERSDGHTVTSQKDAIRAAAERDTNPAVVEDLAAEREAAGETARRRVGVAQNDSTRVNGFNTSNLKVTASVPIPQPAPVDPCAIRPELCEDREDDAGGGGGGGGQCGYCQLLSYSGETVDIGAPFYHHTQVRPDVYLGQIYQAYNSPSACANGYNPGVPGYESWHYPPGEYKVIGSYQNMTTCIPGGYKLELRCENGRWNVKGAGHCTEYSQTPGVSGN